jgi:hypothetical protein
MSKRCELQKEYYQAKGNYKGSGKYSDDYVMWLENEVLALRQPLVISSFCTCRNAELEKDSLVPVYCHNCNAYVQTDL